MLALARRCHPWTSAGKVTPCFSRRRRRSSWSVTYCSRVWPLLRPEASKKLRSRRRSPQAARPYCRTERHCPAKIVCLWKPSLPLPSQGQSPPPTSMQFPVKIPVSSRRTHSCGSSAPSSLRRWWSFCAILCIQQAIHRRWECSYPSCSVGPGMPSQHHLQLSPCYTQEGPGRGEALQGSR